jgi:hypothetical protein
VSIDQLNGPSCLSSSYTNVFCESPGTSDTITWNGTLLPPNTTYYITVDGFAGNNCDFDIRMIGAVNVILPIQTLTFDGENDGNFNKLFWQTSNEEDLDLFILERSPNGVKYNSIHERDVSGHVNSLNNYTFLDTETFNGWNYYRLKQVDIDGQYVYSKTVALYVDRKVQTIHVYPNPAQDHFVFDYFTSVPDNELSLGIYDVQGRLILQRAFELTSNQLQQKINTDLLPPGVYMIRFNSGSFGKVMKLIITR